MTEKRFKLSKPNGAYLIDGDKPYAHWINDDDKIVDLLNSLADENEQLKDKYNEQSVQYEGLEEQVERLLDFKDNVFNLINAKIKHYEHKPFSAPVGQPMSVNFDADVDRIARLSELQDLKRELQE